MLLKDINSFSAHVQSSPVTTLTKHGWPKMDTKPICTNQQITLWYLLSKNLKRLISLPAFTGVPAGAACQFFETVGGRPPQLAVHHGLQAAATAHGGRHLLSCRHWRHGHPQVRHHCVKPRRGKKERARILFQITNYRIAAPSRDHKFLIRTGCNTEILKCTVQSFSRAFYLKFEAKPKHKDIPGTGMWQTTVYGTYSTW